MPSASNGSDAFEGPFLTVAILDSDAQRRKAAAEALAGNKSLQVTEISSFPGTVEELAKLLPQTYNVVLFNVDCDRDLAFELAESLTANPDS